MGPPGWAAAPAAGAAPPAGVGVGVVAAAPPLGAGAGAVVAAPPPAAGAAPAGAGVGLEAPLAGGSSAARGRHSPRPKDTSPAAKSPITIFRTVRFPYPSCIDNFLD